MLSQTLLLLLFLLTITSSYARIIAPASDSTIPFIPDIPLWVRFDAAGVPDGACFAVYLSPAVRRALPPPEGCLSRVGLSLAHTLADLKSGPASGNACAREVCLREDESCQTQGQESCFIDVIYDAVLPPGQYIAHVVVQTSSPSSPSSPPFNFQSKFSVANENLDSPSPPPLSISNPSVGDDYHMHWYNSGMWVRSSWRGVTAHKLPEDMWNYQEIISDLSPSIILEFGVRFGGSALFFADLMRGLHGSSESAGGKSWRVLGVDIDRESIASRVFETPGIEVMIADTFSERVALAVRELRAKLPGPMFVVLDADHAKSSVQLELQLVTRLTLPGDYVIVEDSNLNGHPAYPGWGAGPWEAVTEFLAMNRRAYSRDVLTELKFGHTQAPCGFLQRLGDGNGGGGDVFDPIREEPRKLEEEISVSNANTRDVGDAQ